MNKMCRRINRAVNFFSLHIFFNIQKSFFPFQSKYLTLYRYLIKRTETRHTFCVAEVVAESKRVSRGRDKIERILLAKEISHTDCPRFLSFQQKRRDTQNDYSLTLILFPTTASAHMHPDLFNSGV